MGLLLGPQLLQEVGTTDLRLKARELGARTTVTEESQKEEKPSAPGCENLRPGIIADGLIEPQDGQLRDILVEVIGLNDSRPRIGAEIEADVRLKNIGRQAVQIPWSSDPRVIDVGQGPSQFLWDAGTFEFLLENDEDSLRLVSSTDWLYGTEFAKGSKITLNSEDSVRIKIAFKLANKYFPEDGRLHLGDWHLRVAWHQVQRNQTVKDCTIDNAYFSYRRFYRQRNVPVTIHVFGAETESKKSH